MKRLIFILLFLPACTRTITPTEKQLSRIEKKIEMIAMKIDKLYLVIEKLTQNVGCITYKGGRNDNNTNN